MSATNTDRKSLIACGLLTGKDDTGAIWSHEQIKAASQKQIAACAEAGFDVTPCLIDPEADPRESLTHLKEIIRGKPDGWDAITFGFGIRGTPEYNQLFEDMINAVLTDGMAAKQPRILFFLKPTDMLPTLKKYFGKE